MRKLSILTAAAAALSLGGCVSDYTPPGADVIVTVRTEPAIPSHCLVQDAQGAWNVDATPEHIDIGRARGALDIMCRSPKGWEGHVKVTSRVDPAAVASVVLGSAAGVGITALVAPGIGAGALVGTGIAGGAVGGAIGARDAAYDYPRDIVVPLVDMNANIPPAIVHPAEPVVTYVPVVPALVVRPHVRHRVVHHVPAPHCNCGS